MKKSKIRSKLVIIKLSQRAAKVITAKNRNQFKQSNQKKNEKAVGHQLSRSRQPKKNKRIKASFNITRQK